MEVDSTSCSSTSVSATVRNLRSRHRPIDERVELASRLLEAPFADFPLPSKRSFLFTWAVQNLSYSGKQKVVGDVRLKEYCVENAKLWRFVAVLMSESSFEFHSALPWSSVSNHLAVAIDAAVTYQHQMLIASCLQIVQVVMGPSQDLSPTAGMAISILVASLSQYAEDVVQNRTKLTELVEIVRMSALRVISLRLSIHSSGRTFLDLLSIVLPTSHLLEHASLVEPDILDSLRAIVGDILFSPAHQEFWVRWAERDVDQLHEDALGSETTSRRSVGGFRSLCSSWESALREGIASGLGHIFPLFWTCFAKNYGNDWQSNERGEGGVRKRVRDSSSTSSPSFSFGYLLWKWVKQCDTNLPRVCAVTIALLESAQETGAYHKNTDRDGFPHFHSLERIRDECDEITKGRIDLFGSYCRTTEILFSLNPELIEPIIGTVVSFLWDAEPCGESLSLFSTLALSAATRGRFPQFVLAQPFGISRSTPRLLFRDAAVAALARAWRRLNRSSQLEAIGGVVPLLGEAETFETAAWLCAALVESVVPGDLAVEFVDMLWPFCQSREGETEVGKRCKEGDDDGVAVLRCACTFALVGASPLLQAASTNPDAGDGVKWPVIPPNSRSSSRITRYCDHLARLARLAVGKQATLPEDSWLSLRNSLERICSSKLLSNCQWDGSLSSIRSGHSCFACACWGALCSSLCRIADRLSPLEISGVAETIVALICRGETEGRPCFRFSGPPRLFGVVGKPREPVITACGAAWSVLTFAESYEQPRLVGALISAFSDAIVVRTRAKDMQGLVDVAEIVAALPTVVSRSVFVNDKETDGMWTLNRVLVVAGESGGVGDQARRIVKTVLQEIPGAIRYVEVETMVAFARTCANAQRMKEAEGVVGAWAHAVLVVGLNPVEEGEDETMDGVESVLELQLNTVLLHCPSQIRGVVLREIAECLGAPESRSVGAKGSSLAPTSTKRRGKGFSSVGEVVRSLLLKDDLASSLRAEAEGHRDWSVEIVWLLAVFSSSKEGELNEAIARLIEDVSEAVSPSARSLESIRFVSDVARFSTLLLCRRGIPEDVWISVLVGLSSSSSILSAGDVEQSLRVLCGNALPSVLSAFLDVVVDDKNALGRQERLKVIQVAIETATHPAARAVIAKRMISISSLIHLACVEEGRSSQSVTGGGPSSVWRVFSTVVSTEALDIKDSAFRWLCSGLAEGIVVQAFPLSQFDASSRAELSVVATDHARTLYALVLHRNSLLKKYFALLCSSFGLICQEMLALFEHKEAEASVLIAGLVERSAGLLARHAPGALRKHAPYLLSPLAIAMATFSVGATARSHLPEIMFHLLGVCSEHELSLLHRTLSPSARMVLGTVRGDYERSVRYRGHL